MAEYLALIKLTPSSSPSKVNFSADNVRDAITKLLRYTHSSSTVDIHAYEVLEVVTGGYRPVALKEPSSGVTISTAVIGSITDQSPPSGAEESYSNYTVATA